MIDAPIGLENGNMQIYAENAIGNHGFDRKGRVYRQQLKEALSHYGAILQVPTDAVTGYSSYLISTFSDNHFNPRALFEFLESITGITGGINYHKSGSFKYLPTSDSVDEVLAQAYRNAGFMVDTLGIDFFSRTNDSSKIRKTLFKASIPESDFYLSAKAGSGAGTFSVDLALGIEKRSGFYDTSGEIWRSGFDTERLDNGSIGTRIIRTGNGVKFDPIKASKFDEFKAIFKISPARALTFILIGCMNSLVPSRITALTTEGAKTISSLPNTPTAYNYTGLFREFGFEDQKGAFWMVGMDQRNPRKREIAGVERISEAFRNLVDPQGQSFPLSQPISS